MLYVWSAADLKGVYNKINDNHREAGEQNGEKHDRKKVFSFHRVCSAAANADSSLSQYSFILFEPEKLYCDAYDSWILQYCRLFLDLFIWMEDIQFFEIKQDLAGRVFVFHRGNAWFITYTDI